MAEPKHPNFSKILLFLSQDILSQIDLLFILTHTLSITLYAHSDPLKLLLPGPKMKAIISTCLNLQATTMVTLAAQLEKDVKHQKLSLKRTISAR